MVSFRSKLEFGTMSSMIPAKPIKNPINFLNEKASSTTNRIDKGSTKRGTIAIDIPANPLDTYCCPQLNRENGITFENNPIPRQ